MSLAFISPNPKFTAIDSNGDPYVGAKLYTYSTGTTTPKTTWKDSTKEAANTNPIILDSRGQADVWIAIDEGPYRFKLTDADDVVLWTKDNITTGGVTINAQLREAYAIASGTNTYSVAMFITLTNYTIGDHYLITFANTNTSTTPTLNIDSIGARTIKMKGGGALSPGSISNDHASIIKYDGTDMILLNPVTVSDEAYDADTWDGVITIAPSKNAVRDMRVVAVSDEAYNADTWNNVVTIAPSKNAVRDIRVTILDDPAVGTAGLRTIGTGALQACAGNDARLSNERVSPDASVSQAKLKTSQSSVSDNNNGGAGSSNLVLPGGEYGFYPRTRLTVTGTAGREGSATFTIWASGTQGATYDSGYITNIRLTLTAAPDTYSDPTITGYAQQRYVTSSGEVHWIFILRDKITKSVKSMWQAPDHPCFGNGGKPLLVPHPFGSYDETKHEIIVINPSLVEIEQMELETIVDDETKPDKDLLQIISENYEINEYEEVWPDIPVTVGLPKHIKDKTGKKILADYRFMKGDTIIEPIKKRIVKPDYIKCKSLKRK